MGRGKYKNIGKISLSSAGIISFLLLAYLLFSPRPFYKEGFRNLQELQIYAHEHPELVKTDTDNTLRPVFDSFYEQYRATFFLKVKEKLRNIFSFLFLVRKPIFSASFFKTLLEKLGQQREKKQLSGNLVQKINATPNSKFIIFGNLQGSFHSFVRDLGELKKMGIIDDSLKIIQPDHYIIFMGDVISRSPYSMETLATVARVLETNGEKVFYLRGNHESKNYWQKHALKRELQIRAVHVSTQTLPLEKEVNRFFNTLPLGLYIATPGTTHEFIRVSDAGRRESPILQEHNFSKFLTTRGDTITSFVVKDVLEGDVEESGVQIKSIVRGEKKRESFQKMVGLRFLAPDIDSVAWNILSCPTFVYQKALKFFHDSFVILSAADKIDNWMLTLYNRDLRTKDPFKPTAYFLMTGINAQTNIKMERYRPKPKKQDAKPAPVAQPQPPQKTVQQPVKVAPVTQQKVSPAPITQQQTVKPVVSKKIIPPQKISEKKQAQLPPVSKKIIKQYLIEKSLTPEQKEEVFEEILTKEQKEAIQKKLNK